MSQNDFICSNTLPSSLVYPPYRGEGFEYVSDPESYTSGSVATGRASLDGQVKG